MTAFCSEFGLGKTKTRQLQSNLEISKMNDYGIERNPLFHIISKLVNDNFFCKSESSFVYVNLKRNLKKLEHMFIGDCCIWMQQRETTS